MRGVTSETKMSFLCQRESIIFSFEVLPIFWHKSVAKLKIKDLCAVLSLFHFFEQQYVESLLRAKCRSHKKNHQNPFSSLAAYPISEAVSQPVSKPVSEPVKH